MSQRQPDYEELRARQARAVYGPCLPGAEFKRELPTASDAGRAEGKAEADKDFQRSLDASRADLEVRAIALEWAVAYWAKDGDAKRNSENVVHVADKFEKYLREGKQ